MNLEQIDTSTTAGKAEEFRERPTHRVYRGSCGNLPCHCWAETDHIIGDELIRADLAGEGK